MLWGSPFGGGIIRYPCMGPGRLGMEGDHHLGLGEWGVSELGPPSPNTESQSGVRLYPRFLTFVSKL